MIPDHPPGEWATTAGREHLTGLWKGKSLSHPTPPLCCPISILFNFKLLPDSSTKLQTGAKAKFYFFVSFWFCTRVKALHHDKKHPPRVFAQTPQWKLCELWVIVSDLLCHQRLGERGRIHHWALQGMVNLLETGSLWAETYKISSASQHCRCVTNVKVANLSRIMTNTDFKPTLAVCQHLSLCLSHIST